MSRHLQGGKVEDLADQGDMAALAQGAKLLANSLGMGSGVNLFGGKRKDQFDEEPMGPDPDDEEDDDAEYDGFGDMLQYDEDEDEEGEGADEGMFEEDDAMMSMVGASGAVMDKLGLRRKTFLCDIHHVRLTNLSRRRRDVQVIFTLGAMPGEGGAATLKDVLPSTKAAASASGGSGDEAAAAAAEAERAAAAEAEAEAAAGGKGKKGRKQAQKSQVQSRSDTSKPVVFKTDVAAKVERGRTSALKRKFHGKWSGKYRDLPFRMLHMTLVEQTRFGNLVEIGTSELTLLDLASGSVQQEVTFCERDGRTTIESYRLNFHVHFQVNTRPPQPSPLAPLSLRPLRPRAGELHLRDASR